MTEGQVDSPDETGHHPAEEQTCTEAGGHVERVVRAHVYAAEHDQHGEEERGQDPFRASASEPAFPADCGMRNGMGGAGIR